MASSPSFRPDINGLRAIAVVGVVLYHFGVPGFPGGFAGVDVFFVISGYLMTRIVLGKGTAFSFSGFYAARLRRIVPALAALALALLAGGFFFLIPFDYAQLGRDAYRAMLFVSNIFYARKGGYFDTLAQEQWLLHTWSLSVEAQFYLLFPLLARLCGWRGMALAGAISLLAAILWTPLDQTAAFYLLPARAWELLAGGGVFLLEGKLRPARHLDTAGLALIAGAFFFLSGEDLWPGYLALLPVLGTCAVIAAASGGGASPLLLNRGAQFLGDISYSLYLWHWPVVIAARYFDVAPTAGNIVLQALLAVALAAASYHWIEKPFRHFRGTAGITLVLGIAACLAVALPARALHPGGWPARTKDSVLQAQNARLDVNPRQDECLSDNHAVPPACHLGVTTAAPSAALWGDSHADAVFTAFDAALTQAKRAGVFYGLSSCPPQHGAAAERLPVQRCRDLNRHAFAAIVGSPAVRDVFIAARWTTYPRALDALPETLCALVAAGKTVHALSPAPEMDRNVPLTVAKARFFSHDDPDIAETQAHYADRAARARAALAAAKERCGIDIIDIRTPLCDATHCPGQLGGALLYHDAHHLSRAGAARLVPLFNTALKK